MPIMNGGGAEVATALIAWQETGEERWLETLVARTTTEFGHLAVSSLRRHGVHDRSAIDDALALVFDHLRRLRGSAPGEHAVARFDAARPSRSTHADPGRAYLVWLVRERSLDVARQRRRLAKHRRPLSDRAVAGLRSIDPRDGGDDLEQWTRFHEAIERIEPRLRTVVEMLIAGNSQAAIAHVLDVCEGTVSRLRARAIAELRELLAETPRP